MLLRFVRAFVKAKKECNAIYSDMLIQLRFLHEEGSKLKAFSLSAGSSLEIIRAAEIEIALEANILDLQTLPSSAARTTKLRAKASQLGNSVDTIGRDKR